MKRLLMAAALLAASHAGAASLKEEIMAADAKIFGGLNDRNIEPIKTGFHKQLEFYHDSSGLTNYAENVKAFETQFANKERTVRRIAMPETVEVYPAGKDRAMEVGKHRFCATEKPGGPEGCSIYGFAMVWERTDGLWQLTRVLSYGH